MSYVVGYAGDIGSNSDIAAHTDMALCGFTKFSNIKYIPCITSAETLVLLECEKIDRAIVPMYNNTSGIVGQTHKLIYRKNFVLLNFFDIPIHHYLFSKVKDIKKITRIYSHEQVFSQCKEWLDINLPNVEKIIVGDQAKAAIDLANGLYEYNDAVICSYKAGKNNGLRLLAEQIEDNKDNKTMFGVFIKNKN